MVRSEMIKKRIALSSDEVKIRSYNAQRKICALECFKMSKRVMLYMPIQNEVDTSILFSACFAKKVYIPRVIGDGKMEIAEITDGLRKGVFGIEEPIAKKYTGNIDLFVIPGLYFSENGARIGRGAGYYDRFLMGRSGIKIGLCYSFQIDNNIIPKKNDVNMDLVVTDEEIYWR